MTISILSIKSKYRYNIILYISCPKSDKIYVHPFKDMCIRSNLKGLYTYLGRFWKIIYTQKAFNCCTVIDKLKTIDKNRKIEISKCQKHLTVLQRVT
jgi:hypothetical protein